MYNIPNISNWVANIFGVETGEKITGDPGGKANIAIEQLAGRSNWLRERLDDSSSAIDKIWSASKIRTELNNVTTINTSIQTANYTVTGKNEYIFADTSGGSWTLTLPASPLLGDIVSMNDLNGSWESNPVTIDRNGQRINGLLENLLCDVNNCCIKLVYSNVTYGWKICN